MAGSCIRAAVFGTPQHTVENIVPLGVALQQPTGTEIVPKETAKEDVDVQPFLDYLKSPEGHEIASRVLTIVEDVKKATLEKTTKHAAFEKWLQAGVIVVVVIATSILSCLGKFETSLRVLFGTMVGYIFGRK